MGDDGMREDIAAAWSKVNSKGTSRSGSFSSPDYEPSSMPSACAPIFDRVLDVLTSRHLCSATAAAFGRHEGPAALAESRPPTRDHQVGDEELGRPCVLPLGVGPTGPPPLAPRLQQR